MANLDSIQRAPRRLPKKPARPARRPQYDTFHETLVPVMPGARAYQQPAEDFEEPIPETPQPTPAEPVATETAIVANSATTAEHESRAQSTVQIITAVLGTLLALRFLISLVTFDHSLAPVRALYTLTDWMVTPFQTFMEQTPIAGLGLIEWGTLIALLAVMAIGTALSRAARHSGM